MRLSFTLFVYYICIILTDIKGSLGFSGPYEIVIHEIASCKDSGTGQIAFGTKITKVGRGIYMYNEDVQVGIPIDNMFKAHVEIQEWGNGGYRPRSIEITVETCEEMWKMVGDTIKRFAKSGGIVVECCPIPVCNFTANNFDLDVNVNKIPVMVYNRYKVIINAFYEGKKVGCSSVIAEAVPKTFG